MRKELICLVIGLSMVIGCGSGEKVIRVAPPSVVNQLRDVLQQIADAGMIDSSIEYAKELVEKAVEADPSKADLEQSVNELERAQGKKAISKKLKRCSQCLSKSVTRSPKYTATLRLVHQENSYLKIHVDRFRSERIRP